MRKKIRVALCLDESLCASQTLTQTYTKWAFDVVLYFTGAGDKRGLTMFDLLSVKNRHACQANLQRSAPSPYLGYKGKVYTEGSNSVEGKSKTLTHVRKRHADFVKLP